MYIYRPYYLIAVVCVQFVPSSIAVFVPKAPAVAGEGSAVGSGARAGDNITPAPAVG